jgi:predicted DNA-binding protein (MmcQ/YjbR family)
MPRKASKSKAMPGKAAKQPSANVAGRIAAIRAHIEKKPGAEGFPLPSVRGVTLYKVANKMFAILEVANVLGVTLKCDQHLIEILKGKYAGVGHRGHLDRRFWINVALDADVPVAEIKNLISGSYDLIVAGLTKKQQAALSSGAARKG